MVNMHEENNGFGPLAKPRGQTATYTAMVLLFLFLCALIAWEVGAKVGVKFYLYEFCCGSSFLVILMGEMLKRVCLLSEECRHRHTRYDGSWKKVLKAVFSFKYGKFVVLPSSLLAVFLVVHSLLEHVDFAEYGVRFYMCHLLIMPLVVYLVGLREPSLVEESQLSERENKNVADGLAWSYYFGYLKIVLPELESQINILAEYRRKIKTRKLFILLPKNCYVRQLIKQADEHVHEDGNLPELTQNQAGIKMRSYKHTVHKVTEEGGREHYLVVEYATPLKSMYEMTEKGVLSREERDQQVMIFIRKLKEILDGDEECQGKYELITLSGDNINIRDILVRAISDASIALPEEAHA